ncbi:hypothetical protein Clacol_008685 [Clathrus columnatus]|uniref:RING-type E3 ubiquitin transferase n=1 Tax=Clathrus columnatus TaxID=1419009 RepID=A0AAV5APW5_9AGAM|nr:hypothetical protein Clacol_008685 [Clathrus columnatus]
MVLSTKTTINSLNINTDISIISQAQRQGDDDDAAKLKDEEEEENKELTIDEEEEDLPAVEEGGDDEHCVICLHEIRDRTILPCAHDRLCFECIFVWCQQSRKCPLCNAPIGPYLIHNYRSDYDYSKHYLPPLRTSPVPPTNNNNNNNNNALLPSRHGPAARPSSSFVLVRNREQVPWGRRRNAQTSQERKDELELAISKRRWIYRHGLYAKASLIILNFNILHVASNSHTRYRPAPTPAQFSSSQDTISRATIFIRRELRVWINLDVEFLTTFILSLMKSIDIRSESAVKLLAEFLDMDISYHVGETDQPSRERFPNAEHFAHELYSYLRSPYKDLTIYDRAVQYEIPSDIPPPPDKPILNRYGRHWETTTTTHDTIAESSRHALHHHRNSHSPHLRFPEEDEEAVAAAAIALSSSPSPPPHPSDSYDNFYNQQYRYRPVKATLSRAPAALESSSGSTSRPGPSSKKRNNRKDDEDDDDRFRENNRDKKGKGKGKDKVREVALTEEIPSKKHDSSDTRDVHGGTWKFKSKNRVDSHRPITRKRERSVSFEEEEEYLTRKKSPFSRRDDVGGGVSGSYESLQQQQNPEILPKSTGEKTTASKSVVTGTSEDKQVGTKIPIPAAPSSSSTIIITDQQPEIPVHPSWGISIKGQAKLHLQLGGLRGGDEEEEDNSNNTQQQPLPGSSRRISLSLSVDEVSTNTIPNDTISLSRSRKPSELLHAHLLRNSSTAAVRRTTNNAGGLDASNSRGSSGSGSSSATVMVIPQNKNNNNNTEIGIDPKEENERRIIFTSSSKNERDLEVAPHQQEAETNSVQSSKFEESILPTTCTSTVTAAKRMSARDIMIRTRARLAKLRNEQDSEVDVNTDADTITTTRALSNTMPEIQPSPPVGVGGGGGGGGGAVSLSTTVRAYLLKQLEEEKKKLISRNSGKRGEDDGDASSTNNTGHRRRRRPFDTEPGGGMDNNLSASDGHGRHITGEISIGKDHHHHLDLITKEEVLRANLLSRKKKAKQGKEVSWPPENER